MFHSGFKFKFLPLFRSFSAVEVARVGWQPLSVSATTLTELLRRKIKISLGAVF